MLLIRNVSGAGENFDHKDWWFPIADEFESCRELLERAIMPCLDGLMVDEALKVVEPEVFRRFMQYALKNDLVIEQR